MKPKLPQTKPKAKAQEALDKAGSSEGGVSEADLEKLQDALEKEMEKLASLEVVDTKIKRTERRVWQVSLF